MTGLTVTQSIKWKECKYKRYPSIQNSEKIPHIAKIERKCDVGFKIKKKLFHYLPLGGVTGWHCLLWTVINTGDVFTVHTPSILMDFYIFIAEKGTF